MFKIPAFQEKDNARQLIADGINVLGLFFIGVMCLSYSVFISSFAELHIQLPFLDFPIFVGEILLAVCFVLFALKYAMTPFPVAVCSGIALYGLWILVKAWQGYFTFGPLAFRNAALFYYPVFAVFTFYFFEKKYFTRKSIAFLIAIFILICVTTKFSSYFLFPSFALFITLLFKVQQRVIKVAGVVLLLLLYNPKVFLTDSKTALMGNLLAMLFIAVLLSVLYLKKRRLSIIVSCCTVLILILGLLQFGSRNQLKALSSPFLLYRQFQQEDAYIKEKMKTFKPITLTSSLYNPNTIQLDEKILLDLNVDKAGDSGVEKDSQNIDKRLKNTEQLIRIAALKSIREIRSIAISGFNANLVINEERITAIDNFDQEAERAIEQITEDLGLEREKFVEQLEIIRAGGDSKEKDLTAEMESIEQAFEDACKVQIGRIFDRLNDKKKELFSNRKKRFFKKITAEPRENSPDAISAPYPTKPSRRTAVPSELPMRPSEGSSTFLRDTMAAAKNLEQSSSSEIAPSSRSLIEERGNMLFRLFIWRDMFVDLTSKPWLIVTGINFGKPQRSISNEVIIAAYGEWMRDGWITPHNSFIHIIYRGGITGIFILFSLLYVFFFLTRKAIVTKSPAMILYCSIIVYWMVISNFLVILELPHYAIPFWSLLGMVLAYSEDSRPGRNISESKVERSLNPS